MARPLCSVVICSYNRRSLLERSIHCYNHARFPLDRLEIVLVDDQSEEDLLSVFNRLDPRIQTRYVRLRKEPGLWRDVGQILNTGIRIAEGANVACTHPEVMVGRDSLTAFCDNCTGWSYACSKVYYLKPVETDLIDTVPWQEEGPIAVRKLPTFYETVPGGNPDYEAAAVERSLDWRSWVFGGHSRETWKKMGGFLVTNRWGSCDVLYSDRRRLIGMADRCAQEPDTYVVHQAHPAPRDGVLAMKDAREVARTLTGWVYPEVDHLW